MRLGQIINEPLLIEKLRTSTSRKDRVTQCEVTHTSANNILCPCISEYEIIAAQKIISRVENER